MQRCKMPWGESGGWAEQWSIDGGFTDPGKGGMGGSETDDLSASIGGSATLAAGDLSFARMSSAIAAALSPFLRFELSLPFNSFHLSIIINQLLLINYC